jgi:CRISPR/Cas system-associated exonuclease Cas4 (RecB family)
VRSTLERIGYKLYPASLGAYYRCPRKFQMRYLRRVRMPFEFRDYLAIGSVTHKALAAVFRRKLDGMPVGSLESYAAEYLKRERYPPEEAAELRATHLTVVIGHMERALGSLPPDSEVLWVEHEFSRPTAFESVEVPVEVAAKVDLVIRHGDGLVDHIDFKTGHDGGDPLQNVMSRVAVAHGTKTPAEQLRTVNVMTKSGAYEIDMARNEQRRQNWQVVEYNVVQLAGDNTWLGTSDPAICRRCEYNTVCDSVVKDHDEYDA